MIPTIQMEVIQSRKEKKKKIIYNIYNSDGDQKILNKNEIGFSAEKTKETSKRSGD